MLLVEDSKSPDGLSVSQAVKQANNIVIANNIAIILFIFVSPIQTLYSHKVTIHIVILIHIITCFLLFSYSELYILKKVRISLLTKSVCSNIMYVGQ